MYARELMSSPPVTASPDMPIRQAIALLVGHGFACLPVVDADNKVIGLFTETADLHCVDCDEIEGTVADAMAQPAEAVSPNTDIADVAAALLDTGARCVPVVDQEVLVGVIARRDLLRPVVRTDDRIASHLRALLDDYAAHRGRWAVSVAAGEVTLTGEFFDAAERSVLEALVRTVPGVARARTEPRPTVRS